jgi:hypothetical protein
MLHFALLMGIRHPSELRVIITRDNAESVG